MHMNWYQLKEIVYNLVSLRNTIVINSFHVHIMWMDAQLYAAVEISN